MILQVENLCKSFTQKKVLNGISFCANSGKALGLLGRNGAGKTTTIRILMNVLPKDDGKILIDGKPIDYKSITFGYLPEERGLYPKKTVKEQLIYFAELKGVDKKEAEKSLDYWLKRLDAFEYKDKRLDTLSKGNQQKIQLITAIIHNPQIVILDEPFSGLDPVNAMLFKDVVKEQINMGKIVLFSSHQMNYIEEFCDDIVILNGGKNVLSGNLAQIKHSYRRDKLVVSSGEVNKILQAYENATQISSSEVMIKLKDKADKKAIMVKLSNEFDIDQIKVYEPSLNDIFVEFA